MPTGMCSSNTSTGGCAPFSALRQPVVSVDIKKKELVGEYRNGAEGRPTDHQRRPARQSAAGASQAARSVAAGSRANRATCCCGWPSGGVVCSASCTTFAFRSRTTKRSGTCA